MVNEWISDNHEELQKICKRVSKLEDSSDLCQICVEQFISNKKILKVPDNEKLYFFTRIVQNQYHSKSSKYHYTYRKYQFNEIVESDIPNVEYEEDTFNMEWVREQLKKIDWYYGRLFELYIEEGCSVTKLSKRTTIPINSVSRDINKVRKQLKQKRNGMRL